MIRSHDFPFHSLNFKIFLSLFSVKIFQKYCYFMALEKNTYEIITLMVRDIKKKKKLQIVGTHQGIIKEMP